MSLTLPSELVWVLDLLGYTWPEVDEEALHQVAETWRAFGAELEKIQGKGEGLARTVVANNAGLAVDGFSKSWGAYTGANGEDRYLPDAKTACEVIAFAFDAAALAVLTAKLAVIVQLVALAIEIIAAQAAAPFTFGLSEIGALGATQGTRLIVRELLDRLKKEVMEAITQAMEHATMDALKKIAKEQLEKITKEKAKQFAKDQAKQFVQERVVDAAKDKAREAAVGMAQNIGQQSVEAYFDARSGIDLGETADVAKTAAGDYVEGLRNEVTGGEGSAFAGYTDLNAHVDNAVNAATERVTGAAGDRVQQGVDALAGHGGQSTQPPDGVAATAATVGSGASRATTQTSTRATAASSTVGSGSSRTAGDAQDWARNEFG
ncbi:PE-PGRS family protein [Streptomyces sp. ISL-22]|uniref:WXG100-like domain-containing protein n=1 Tax=unclassified Streptomyces TaxID=2593676 RepID=UPI001BEBC79F|nr:MULTISPECIES: PE-PGRS family protein [unclassified Streptomyces]MBT2421270.1 PE-PGRS family protein [Streptomyces sp. ISL-24]MBT2437055.1 PE-PGRS family protein [Streptomyces sp. ISL-22]